MKWSDLPHVPCKFFQVQSGVTYLWTEDPQIQLPREPRLEGVRQERQRERQFANDLKRWRLPRNFKLGDWSIFSPMAWKLVLRFTVKPLRETKQRNTFRRTLNASLQFSLYRQGPQAKKFFFFFEESPFINCKRKETKLHHLTGLVQMGKV